MKQRFRTETSFGARMARLVIAAVAMLALPAQGFAGSRANLVGTVIDSIGKPVVGVEIQILDGDGHPIASAVSGERGRYKIRCLEQGSYGVRLIPGQHDVRGRTVTVKVTEEGRRLDWTVDHARPALPRPMGSGGRCTRTAYAAARPVAATASDAA